MPTSMKPFRAAAALFVGLALWSGAARLNAAVTWPNLMNYQGQLTDALGTSAVADASYSVLFSLYGTDTGGSPLWSETQAVTTRKGLFRVVLGSVNPLSSLPASAYTSDLWLGLTVGADAEMTPRQQLLPGAYAKNAQTVGGLLPNNAANNLVVLDAGGKIPAGLVQGGSLAAPLDLAGSSAAYTLNVSNTSAAAGAVGVYTSAPNGLLAQALNASGYGLWGSSTASDTTAAAGVKASSSNGMALLAQSSNGVGVSATTQSATAPALFAGGAFPARFLASSAASGNAAVIAATSAGDQAVSLADRANNAGVVARVTGGGLFGVSATAGGASAIFGQTNSGNATDYGVWGANSAGGATGVGVYGSGGTGVQGVGSSVGVSGSSSAGTGVSGIGGIGVLGQVNKSASFAVEGIVDAAYSSSVGVLGLNNGATGTGVLGRHLGAGAGVGIRGGSPSGVGGLGVYGSASGTGGAMGVQGYASASDGYGTAGFQGNASALSYVAGVLGRGFSLVSGTGVRGEGNQGVYGISGNLCGVCAYNQNTASSYPIAGLYATSPYNAILAESTNGSAVGYGIYATTQSTFDTSAAGYFAAKGASGVTDGLFASNLSAGGHAIRALGAAGTVNYYSDASQQPAYGFYHADNSPAGNAVGIYAVENCATCYAGDFINTAAQSGNGAALNVQGRLRVQSSAGTFQAPNGATTYTLTNSYITSNCLVFLTVQTATSSVAAVTAVGAGSATITFTPPLAGNTNYQFLVIGQ